MQLAVHPHPEAHRRPSGLDLTAAFLLLATVVLHVVAMAPNYFEGAGAGKSLMAQPDQAALYAVLAAAWALALAVGLTGPSRTPVSAGLAVGIAATELGFRVSDLGSVFRYGLSTAGAGLWLMVAAWGVGAAAAGVAVLAVWSRHGNLISRPRPAASEPEPVDTAGASAPAGAEPAERSVWDIDWAAPALPGVASGSHDEHPDEEPGRAPSVPTLSMPVAEADAPTNTNMPISSFLDPATTEVPAAPRSGDTGVLTPVAEDPHAKQERTAWTMLVVVLALLVAGAFLPPWDHYIATSTVTGRTASGNLGNAFSNPWQVIVGTMLAAVALAVVPIVGVRLRHRAVGAAMACGSLLVLATQLVSAIVQVDQPVSPSVVGLSQAQANQLGLQLSLRLTGWFTVDAIAAYALFAAIMVWATLRVVHHNSMGHSPQAAQWGTDAMSWGP